MKLFEKNNLTAWCIVPFDAAKRGPQERAQMLKTLGIQRLAYDWRDEHIPSFDAELQALREQDIDMHAIYLLGGWPESEEQAWSQPQLKAGLEFLQRNELNIEVWVTYAGEGVDEEKHKTLAEQYDAAAARVAILADIVNALGCRLCIYNHGGWGGEPATMQAIAERLQKKNVGVIYNFHHGHEHLAQMPQALDHLLPYLASINLNGMNKDGPKILPIGSGEDDYAILRMIHDSGYQGPIGILDHRMETDAEESLLENLNGLASILQQAALTDA